MNSPLASYVPTRDVDDSGRTGDSGKCWFDSSAGGSLLNPRPIAQPSDAMKYDIIDIISNALMITFKSKGFDVVVKHDYDVCCDQIVWAVICGKSKEFLRISRHALKGWDRSKPVPFEGDGPEVYIGRERQTDVTALCRLGHKAS